MKKKRSVIVVAANHAATRGTAFTSKTWTSFKKKSSSNVPFIIKIFRKNSTDTCVCACGIQTAGHVTDS